MSANQFVWKSYSALSYFEPWIADRGITDLRDGIVHLDASFTALSLLSIRLLLGFEPSLIFWRGQVANLLFCSWLVRAPIVPLLVVLQLSVL